VWRFGAVPGWWRTTGWRLSELEQTGAIRTIDTTKLREFSFLFGGNADVWLDDSSLFADCNSGSVAGAILEYDCASDSTR
jgi:hypothetical protein